MKKNYTQISVILDKSGSMKSLTQSTISNFNEFIGTQRVLPGTATVSLMQFDDRFEESYSFKDIKEVPELNSETYKVRGMTSLYDAVGKTMTSMGEHLSKMPEDERPEKVLMCIVTDGLDNTSTDYNKERIAAMIKEQSTKYNWQFLYLGANQDAFAEGSKMGLTRGQTFSYAADPEGVSGAYTKMSHSVSSFRKGETKDLKI